MRKKLIVFGLLCVISTALFSQNEWVSQYNTAQQSYVDGDLVSATTSAKNSLKNYLQQSGEINANYQSILRLLSTISFESGSYQEGIEYGDKELSILDQLGASKDLTYAGVLYNLGSTHQQLGNNEQAQNYLNLTLDIYRGYYANTDEELINCQWKLASIKFAENHIEEAFQLFSEAFANYGDREEVTPDYLYACYDYGNLLMEKDDHAQCVQYLGIVKRIYEDSGYNDTEEYQNVIERMANAYQKVDRLKAEEMYVLALNKYSTSIENSSDVYIGLMNNRAVNLQAMGKTEEAQAILKTVGGQGGNDVSSLNNLAALSQQEGDYQEAEKLYVQALEMISDQVSKEYAEVMENLAMVYVNTGRTQLATESIGKSSTIIRSVYGDTNLRYASSLRKQALIAKSNRDFALAEQSYENALAITSQSNDESLLHLQTLNGMAVLFKELGKYNQADSLFEVARLGADNLASQHSGFYALLLNNQAALKEIKGENLAAKELFMKSLGLMESADNTGKTYLATLENLSTIHIELGEYDQAEAVLEKSQQLIAEKYGETSSIYAANVLNYGRLEQAMGRYPKAEPHFKTALELMKSNHGDQHPEYARALNAMALYFQILGNMNEAEPLLEQSKNIYEVTYGKSHPEYITSIENLSSLYQMQGEKEKALPLLQEALAMDSEVYGIDHPIYATTLHNLASLYQSMGDQVKAEPLFVQALTIDERIYGKQHRSYAKTLYNLGTLYQDLGKYDEAETTLLEVLAIRKEILGEEHPDYAYSLYGIASLYHATQNLNKAFPFYEQVINKYIKQIDEYFPSMSEKEKSAYYAKIKPVFDAFFDFCVDYQLYDQSVSQVSPIARMYDLQLSTKALLLNATNKVRDRILESGDEQLIADYREWTSTKERLVKYFNYTQKELVDQSIDVNLLRQQANELEKVLSTKSQLFASQHDKAKKSWIDVRNTLGDKEAAIEIIRIQKKFRSDSVIYVALIVTNEMTDTPDFVVLGEGNKMESRWFNFYRNSIKFSIGNNISYDGYWLAISQKLDGIDRVYFSADGIYNKININTLWDPVKELSVIEDLELRIVSNTRELTEVHQVNEDRPNTAEIYGFPDFNLGAEFDDMGAVAVNRTSEYGFSKGIASLPGTKVEVEEIAKMLTENNWVGNIRTSAEATEDKFKNIDSPRLLHIATHGFFMNDIEYSDRDQSSSSHNDLNANPLLRSGVLLTGSAKAMILDQKSDGEDGIVTAYEAMNLNLDNTEIVVLSACETGLGEVRNGEGVYGLQRAFIVAGAQNVIMSLWKVNDLTTQELMAGFYQRWLGGMDKFQAFKETQLALKNKYNDPYHWGSFVLLGK